MRESTVRGPAVDLGEFERRLRGPERTGAEKADPLSELARLMEGREAAEADPYSHILADPRPQTPPHADPSWDAQHAGLRGSYDAAPPVSPEPRHFDDAHGDAAYADAAYHHEPAYQHHEAAAPAYPDQHAAGYHGAEGGWADDTQYLDYGSDDEPMEAEREPGGIRRYLRPWHAVAAISVLAIASIAWGFAHRSGVGSSRDIAVINAPEGPVKVKPSAEVEQDAPNAGAAAVLDRKETAAVKQVVTNREQAVDPTVTPRTVKLGAGPVDAPHEPALAPTQPRKVKTVTVRPDGTRVEDAALPPAVAKATNPPAADTARSSGGTPKAATKPTTTTTQAAAKPKPPAKTAAVEEPAASAAETSGAAPVASGGYAVQFGAAGSEAEARTLLKTVAAKYGAQLGGHKPTFKPAQVGDKTVYRVRVGGVSKESANAICGKVKASGGSCFVAGN